MKKLPTNGPQHGTLHCSRFSRKNIIWAPLGLLIPIFILFSFTLKKGNQATWNAKEWRMNKNEVESLFSRKISDQILIGLQVDGKPGPSAEIVVNQHINQGEKSGALACGLTLDGQKARLLINRKERGGRLVYWMAVLPEKGEQGFKLKEDTGKEFILENVPVNQIVTE